MYRTIKDFLDEWKEESAATLKIFEALTDDALHLQNKEGIRSMQRLAWHISMTIGEMLARTGVHVDGPAHESSPVDSVAELLSAYRAAADSAASAIATQWTDSSLDEKHNMYGEEWTKGVVLNVLVHHQIHHRGQLTMLMRQAGLVVPGIYGPARHEWIAMGMAPLE